VRGKEIGAAGVEGRGIAVHVHVDHGEVVVVEFGPVASERIRAADITEIAGVQGIADLDNASRGVEGLADGKGRDHRRLDRLNGEQWQHAEHEDRDGEYTGHWPHQEAMDE
jgi:hypothetical protein